MTSSAPGSGPAFLQQPPPITEVPVFSRGKVRDMYDLGDHLLMVASDRISAFDVVLPTPVPGKGAILTALSRFWFDRLGVPNHLVTAEVSDYPPVLHRHLDYLRGRSMVVKKAKRFDVECVVRGYLAGSGWKDYRETGAVCGQALPEGLRISEKLPSPLFTPAAKNDTGHDENISFAQMVRITGAEAAEELRSLSLTLYARAAAHAAERGVLLADTKFEFGLHEGRIILIDEVLTPDSSRFWPAADYAPGREPPSFDKQFVRDHLAGLAWDKTYPGPELPESVVQGTLSRYREAYRLLTGKEYRDG